VLDTEYNRNNLVALTEHLMRPNETILFAGAGVSAAAGYPGWASLMDRMEERLQRELQGARGIADLISPKDVSQIKNINDLLWKAQEYRRVLGKTIYNEVLNEAFDTKLFDGPPQIALALIRLRFAHVLTTNFEPSLENAYKAESTKLTVFEWTEKEKIRDFITRQLHRSDDRCFIYLHGRIDTSRKPAVPDNLVLADADYVDRYLLTSSTVHKMLAIFMTRPVVFVGFSFTDPAVQMIFQALTAHLGGAESATCTHFILSPEPAIGNDRAEASWLRGKYGVQPVYYKSGAKHADLTVTLNQIATVIEQCRDGYEQLDDLNRRRRIQQQLERAVSPSKQQVAVHLPATTKTRKLSRKPPQDDPNKWQFGSESSRDGYKLSAQVTEVERGWFSIVLEVTAAPGKTLGNAKFFLHPSFAKQHRMKSAIKGRISLKLEAYGAFTVGVLINPEPDDDARSPSVTALELDLAELTDAPPLFRSR
jgi:SIR2-like domain